MTTTTAAKSNGSVVNSQGEDKIIKLVPGYLNPDMSASMEFDYILNQTSLKPKVPDDPDSEDDHFDYLTLPKGRALYQSHSISALKILRTHYSGALLSSLEWLSENHESDSSNSLPYLSSLLNLIKEYTEKYFEDPFSSYLMALYDGLIHQDSYFNINKSVYQNILSHIKTLNNQELDYKKVDKFIYKLEELGLNTTPY